ncbi:hypothetical protein FI667_g11897, partial [Globisporangium splendens]
MRAARGEQQYENGVNNVRTDLAASVPEKMTMEGSMVESGGPGLLTELIISSFEQNTQLMLQYLENALFDDLVKDASVNL